MSRPITKGTLNVSIVVRVIDDTDGTPETGVTFETTGVDLWYRREGAAKVSITEVTLAALTTAHADGGFLHIADGYCRLDLPDAAAATGADGVQVGGTFTGMVVIGCYIPLTDMDLYDGVRGGMTSLPNAVVDAAGGLVISDAGGLDIDAMNVNINDIETDTNELQTDNVPGLIATLDAVVDTVKAETVLILEDTGTTLPATLATIDGNVDTINTATGGLGGAAMRGTDGANTTTPLTAAQVNAECDTAITDYDAPTKAEMDAAHLVTDALIAGVIDSPHHLQSTTINTLASQISFTLVAGSADDDAYNDAIIVIEDSATATQKAVGLISDYTGSSKTVTLSSDPGIFTMAVGDNIKIMAALGSTGNVPTVVQIRQEMDSNSVDLNTIITNIAGLNDLSAAQVNAECDTAITDAALATAAALATVDTVADAIKVITDALGATAAAQLNLSANQIITGTVDTVVNTHTPLVTEFQADDITEATADHFNGRIIIFTSGALAGQATAITDYERVTTIGQFTVVAMTEAPANNDTFIIL